MFFYLAIFATHNQHDDETIASLIAHLKRPLCIVAMPVKEGDLDTCIMRTFEGPHAEFVRTMLAQGRIISGPNAIRLACARLVEVMQRMIAGAMSPFSSVGTTSFSTSFERSDSPLSRSPRHEGFGDFDDRSSLDVVIIIDGHGRGESIAQWEASKIAIVVHNCVTQLHEGVVGLGRSCEGINFSLAGVVLLSCLSGNRIAEPGSWSAVQETLVGETAMHLMHKVDTGRSALLPKVIVGYNREVFFGASGRASGFKFASDRESPSPSPRSLTISFLPERQIRWSELPDSMHREWGRDPRKAQPPSDAVPYTVPLHHASSTVAPPAPWRSIFSRGLKEVERTFTREQCEVQISTQQNEYNITITMQGVLGESATTIVLRNPSTDSLRTVKSAFLMALEFSVPEDELVLYAPFIEWARAL